MRTTLGRARRPEAIVGLLTFVVAVAIATFMVRPFQAGTLGYDAAGSVLYFDRIVAGRQLEAFLGATPKPLLTLVYGLVHSIIPDWRAISWLAIVAYGAGIGALSALAYRVGGAVAAGFCAAGLLGSAELLQDVDLAYAVSWALLCWAVAGLLVTASRPRYGWAGIALAVGALARFETLIVVALGALVLCCGAILARRRRRSTAAIRERAPILLGLLALPIQMTHDVFLAGDPFYSQSVPVLGSVGLRLVGMSGVAAQIGAHYAGEPVLILLATLGLSRLLRRRQWTLVCGIVALSVGVLAFLLFLGWRGTYVSARYIAPVDLALTFAAAIGASSIRIDTGLQAVRSIAGRGGLIPFGAVVGAVLAVALIRPLGPLDPATRKAIVVNGAVHRDLDRVTPTIRTAISETGGLPPWPTDGSPTRRTGWQAAIMVPILTVPQLAVDLDLPLSALTGTVGDSLSMDGSYPRPGQLVFHDVDRDAPAAAFKMFEVTSPTLVGRLLITPILVDPRGRFWLVRIGP